MTPQSTHLPDPEHDGDAAPGRALVRIILVGRTGFEAAARRDERIELLRVRTAMEAVGELGDPIDLASPTRNVVIVGSDADPDERAGSFIAALKMIDPAVAVLLVDDNAPPPGTNAPLHSGDARRAEYDAQVPRGSPIEKLLAIAVRVSCTLPPDLVQVKAGASPNQPTLAPVQDAPPVLSARTPSLLHAPAAGPPAWAQPPSGATAAPFAAGAQTAGLNAASHHSARPPDEIAMVDALLTGRDLLLPALALLRARTGDPDLRFVPATEENPVDTAPDNAEPVLHRATLLGLLVPGIKNVHPATPLS